MAGSPDADWFREMRKAAVDVVVHCSVTLDGTTMDFHNWASGGLDATITGDPLLSSITSVTQQVDPIERSVQASELSLELLDDGKIRGLVASQNFLNSLVTVKLGTAALNLADFELIFKGPIVRLQPVEGKITIKVQALEAMVMDGKNFRTYYNKHPFEVIDQMLQDSGVDSGDIDSTSFTPSTYSAGISHYCFSSMVTGSDFENDMFWDYTDSSMAVGAAGTSYIHDWTYHVLRFIPFVNEILKLTRTSMFVNTEGKIALKHFDASEAVVKHFTTDDYSDFVQVEKDVPIYNKMNCVFRNSGPQRFVRKDDTSITNYEEQTYETPVLYLAPYSRYYEDGGVPQAGDIVPGFAGVKNILTSQSTEAPSADRPVYWLHRQEVIKATGAFTATNQYYGSSYAANGDLPGSIERFPRYITMSSVATRPFFGNQSGEGVWQNKVWDLTATYDFCDYVLVRFSNTAPTIRIATTLEFAYLEIGDLVSLDNDVFLCPELALAGLDSSVKFEIVGREITPLGDSVNIVFDLVYATKTSPPSTSLASQIAGKFETMMPDSILDAVSNGLMGVNSVGAGLDLGAGSGLEGTIAPGSASAGGQFPIGLAAQLGFVAVANRHNYVGINGLTGEPIVTDVATSDPEPRLGPSEIRLGLAVAGGSSISSVSDLRQIGNVSADQIDKNMIAPGMTILWNPSFDIWPDTGSMPPGWDDPGYGVVGTDIIRSDTTKSGPYSLSAASTGTAVRFKSSKFPVDALKTYRASFWMKQTASFTMTTTAYWYQSDRTASGVTGSNIIYNSNNGGSSDWFQRSIVVTPPSDAAYCAIDISRASTPGGIGYWDEFQFREELPSFLAYAPATTSIVKAAGFAIVDYGSEAYDHGGNFSSSTFTAPADGLYQFECQISCTAGSSFSFGDSAEMYFRHVDAAPTQTAFGRIQIGAASTANLSIASVATKEMLAGETVDVRFQVYGESVDLNATLPYTWFGGRQLS